MPTTKRILVAVLTLIITGIACTLGQAVAPKPAEPDVPAGQLPLETQVQPQAPGAEQPQLSTPIPATPTANPSDPVGLRQGLSTLNSYRMNIRVVTNGPTSLDKSDSSYMIESGSDGSSTHINYKFSSSSQDEPEGESGETDEYYFGNRQCSYPKDSELSAEDIDPLLKEVLEAWYGLFDLVPVVNQPEFIGAEDLNGVLTNHFRFKVGGLGVKTGAEVISSDGEYWLAQDGRYLIKYIVRIETRSGPAGDANTKAILTEFSIDVVDINQNIVIEIPSGCR